MKSVRNISGKTSRGDILRIRYSCAMIGCLAWMLNVMFSGMAYAASFTNRPTINDGERAVSNLIWIQNALIERYHAVNTNVIDTSCPHLADIKAKVKDIVQMYADTNEAVGGNYETYMRSHDNILPMLSVTSLADRIKYPTNYFDYTPFTFIAPPEILTNGYTLSGGLYFPPGRTNWLTTDYQWYALTNILRAMAWSKGMIYWDAMDNIWYGGVGWWGGYSNSWNDAIYAAESAWRWQGWDEMPCGPFQYSMGWWEGDNLIYAIIGNTYSKLTAFNIFTGICHSVDVYYKAMKPEGEVSFVWDYYGDDYIFCWGGDPMMIIFVDSGVFDDNGTSNIYTNMTRIAQWPEGAYSESNILIGVVGDATNDPGFPVWCDPPTTNNFTARGWWSDKWRSVIKWDGPGGFQYK